MKQVMKRKVKQARRSADSGPEVNSRRDADLPQRIDALLIRITCAINGADSR